MDDLDPLVELERLIQARTCEVCNAVWSEVLSRYWKCRAEKKGGYTSKHWRNWRLCPNCLSRLSLSPGSFASWMFPVIANMSPHDVIDDLVAVQPMQAPAPGMFYLDLVVGPGRPVVNL